MSSPALGCPVMLGGGTGKGTSVDETGPMTGWVTFGEDIRRDRLHDRVAVPVVGRDQVAVGAGVIRDAAGGCPSACVVTLKTTVNSV